MSFYSELKRRNVFRVAIAYLAGAWLLIEVSGTLFPVFGIPDWGVRFVVIVLSLGFLPALVVSWVYEMTPEGLKREADVVRDASITHLTARRLDGITIGLIVIALAFVTLDRLWLSPELSAPPTEQSQAVAEVEETAGAQPVEHGYPSNAIAVLPFVNMSGDVENEYFSDGVSEELLNLLAKIPELRVIARTSSFAFKGKDATIEDVARELQVGHVLEGSVRKAGNQVRITAQLIRTSDSSHLWSETYDRSLENIFAIQDEIAAEVVGQLKIKLLGDTPRTKVVDPEAYTLFLRAGRLNDTGTITAYQQAADLLEQALAIAPDYSPAWSELGRNWQNQAAANMVNKKRGYAESSEAQRRALELDPGNAAALSRMGFHLVEFKGDLPGAAKLFEKALSLEPWNAIVLSNAASLAMTLGRVDQAVTLREIATQLDPLSALKAFNLGWSYFVNEQLDEALAAFRKCLLLSPEKPIVRAAIVRVLYRKGDFSNLEEVTRLIAEEPFEPVRLAATMALQYHLGNMAESDAALKALIEKYPQGTGELIALAYAFRGDTDQALVELQRAVEAEGPQILMTSWYTPEFKILHDDPRWDALLSKAGVSKQQLARIPFEFELPD